MNALRRPLAVYAVLLAAVVGAHFILTPLYDDGSTGFPVWTVLNWFMAAGVLLALLASLDWKRRAVNAGADGSDLRRYLEANVLFYVSAILGLWFFWNWFRDLMSRDDPTLWAFIDPLFVMVVGAAGFRLWRDADAAQ